MFHIKNIWAFIIFPPQNDQCHHVDNSVVESSQLVSTNHFLPSDQQTNDFLPTDQPLSCVQKTDQEPLKIDQSLQASPKSDCGFLSGFSQNSDKKHQWVSVGFFEFCFWSLSNMNYIFFLLYFILLLLLFTRANDEKQTGFFTFFFTFWLSVC